jgi:hypothetical protein
VSEKSSIILKTVNTATKEFDKHVLKRTADCRIRVSRACKRGIFSRFFYYISEISMRNSLTNLS